MKLQPQAQPQAQHQLRAASAGVGLGRVLLPAGHLLRLSLYETWGDPHYIGLAGLELLDASGMPIRVTARHLATVPGQGLNDLPENQGRKTDCRTPDKLLDGDHTGSASHSWLAPYTPGKPVTLYVVFDQAVVLGALKLWNYAKTPDRGVRAMVASLDDLIIFQVGLRFVHISVLFQR